MSAQTPIASPPEVLSTVEPGSNAPREPAPPPAAEPEIALEYWDEAVESLEVEAAFRDEVSPLLARILGGIGQFFIVLGVLLLLFAGFQLWGTGLAESRAQDDLAKRFADRLAEVQVEDTAQLQHTAELQDTAQLQDTAEPQDTTELQDTAELQDTTELQDTAELQVTADPAVPETPQTPELINPDPGEPIGLIEIPAIGVQKTIVEGTTRDALRSGPGHYRSTPLPGRAGNTAIAGHRTTHGAPFFDLDLLQPGDEIQVETLEGTATYLVEAHDDGTGGQIGHLIVDPGEVGVIADQGDNRLTLTACHPKYSAKERIIVTAALVSDLPAPVLAIAAPVENPPASETIETSPDTDATELAVDGPVQFSPERPVDIADSAVALASTIDAVGSEDETVAASLGWQREFLPHTMLWALITGLIAATGWLVGRCWRRWPSYAMTVPPFSLALFYCFSNLEKFIPAV